MELDTITKQIYNDLKANYDNLSRPYNTFIENYRKLLEINSQLTCQVRERDAVLLMNNKLGFNARQPYGSNLDLHFSKSSFNEETDINVVITDLKAENKRLREKLSSSEESAIKLNDNNKLLSSSLEFNTKEVERLKKSNQILSDEVMTLQIALHSTEEKLTAALKETQEILDQFLELKKKQVDFMNEMTEKSFEKLKRNKDNNQETTVNNNHFNNVTVKVPDVSSFKTTTSDDVTSGCCSKDGRRIYVGIDKNPIKFHIEDDQLIQSNVFKGSISTICSIDVNNEETLLICGSTDRSCKIWSIDSMALTETLTGHQDRVQAVKFNNFNSKQIITGSKDRYIKLWDIANGICLKDIYTGSICTSLVIDDHQCVVSGHWDKRIRLWDLRSETVENELELSGKITGISLAKDDRTIVACLRDNCLCVTDIRKFDSRITLKADGFVVPFDWSSPCISPDSNYVAAGSQNGSIIIWDVNKKNKHSILNGHRFPVIGCLWNDSGHGICSWDSKKNLLYWI